MCPLCKQACQRETLNEEWLCGVTGFAYIQDATGKIVVSETNRTQPAVVNIRQRVTWTLGETARVKA